MNDAQLDRIIEQARDSDVDALMGDEKPLPFQMAARPEGFVYDRESWHADCADKLYGTVLMNDRLRNELRQAIWWHNRQDAMSTHGKLIDAAMLVNYLSRIGAVILTNAIENGLTETNLGEFLV